jgi:hypothetical protein
MTRQEATAQATAIARKDRTAMVVVLEGPHRDDHAPEDSHGYCPAAAKETLYRFATVVEEIPAGGAS